MIYWIQQNVFELRPGLGMDYFFYGISIHGCIGYFWGKYLNIFRWQIVKQENGDLHVLMWQWTKTIWHVDMWLASWETLIKILFTIYRHFTDQTTNWLLEKITISLAFNGNDQNSRIQSYMDAITWNGLLNARIYGGITAFSKIQIRGNYGNASHALVVSCSCWSFCR